MPVTSPKQFRFMQMVAHGKKPSSGIGPSPDVAKEFLSKTPSKKKTMFAKGNK